ncbi:MAG TPA: restriction endonuclease subunit S [Flavobacteriaceae bacterium]|uniref:restriction endonuclease subunit S n=2 Tax=Bacteroidota/Chlorobiota group TaxID=68336 RepID=UPI000E7DC20E|nr:restriction endonuclease subunit S [Sphingobacterium multivorum]HBX63813.1 restriction endonuclease subunit S [Flavobacteriaceae bacterium]
MVKDMKQTEIGLIPEDWEVKELGDFCDTYSGGTPNSSISEYYNGNIPWISSGELNKNIIRYTDSFISEKGLQNSASKLVEENTLLIAMYGATAGVIAISKIVGAINQAVLAIKNDVSKSNNIFLKNFLDYKKEWILSTYTQGGQPNLNQEIIRKIQIPLPPLAEQEAIANALSDADAWIEKLEQIITKKRLIKQGAMQTLLTPKEDWEERSIFEIADCKRDLFNDGDWIESEHIKDEGIRLVQTGNIGVGKFLNKSNKKYISEKSFSELKCKELSEGDLLICRLAEPAGRVCLFPKTEDYKSVTSVDVTIFRPNESKYDRRFLLYSLSTENWFKDVIEQVGGTTHKRISRGNLGTLKIKLPKSLSEQERIATILSDMDAEIEALEQQLGKARHIKQGMMQELLTGKTRLV